METTHDLSKFLGGNGGAFLHGVGGARLVHRVFASKGASSLAHFARAAEFGIQPYGQLAKQTAGSGLRAHHLIERRFADILGVNASAMEAIALTGGASGIYECVAESDRLHRRSEFNNNRKCHAAAHP